jgi:hypothetical protein
VGGDWIARWVEQNRLIIETRFWAKVNKTDACWLWVGSLDKDGYGQIAARHDGRTGLLRAHRLSWVLAYGSIPEGLVICHKCDVRSCIRAEHLFLGTHQDNIADARQKGRLNNSLPRPRKLTLADRLAIYHMPNRRGLGVELALRYGVTKTCICLTRRGRFVGSPLARVFERVPHVQLPVRGEVA